MEVVHVHHPVDAGKVGGHGGEIEVPRRRLQQDAQRLTTETQRPGKDEQPDAGGDDRIDPRPPGDPHHAGAEDHPERAERVGHHLDVRALDVEGLLRPRSEQQERHDVHREAEHSDDEHGCRRDVGRFAEPGDGLEHHVRGNADEQDRVGERREDLETVNTERVVLGPASPGRHSDRGERHAEAEDIGGHVSGVGEQGEGVGSEPRDDLHHQEAEGQREGDGQRTLVPGPGAHRCRTVVVGVPAAAVVVSHVAIICDLSHMTSLGFSRSCASPRQRW